MKGGNRTMRYKKHATYLLFGVVGFTLFVSAFSAISYKYYKTDHSSGVEYWIISPDYPVWPPKQLTEIAYDDYKAELRKGNWDITTRRIRQPFPYVVGGSLFLILLFTDPLRKRFEIETEN